MASYAFYVQIGDKKYFGCVEASGPVGAEQRVKRYFENERISNISVKVIEDLNFTLSEAK